MRHFFFNLSLSAHAYQQYYCGSVEKVVARCVDGRTVQFPAGLLIPFVTSGGVHGDFVLTCDENGKGAELKRRTGPAYLRTASRNDRRMTNAAH